MVLFLRKSQIYCCKIPCRIVNLTIKDVGLNNIDRIFVTTFLFLDFFNLPSIEKQINR